MNRKDIGSVIDIIKKIWPRNKWKDGEWKLLTADLERYRLSVDQAVAVVEEVKRTCNYGSPPFGSLTKMLTAAHHSEMREEQMKPHAQAVAVDNTPDYYPGGLTMSQARKLWSGGKKEAVHRDWWPVLEELDRYPGILAKYATQKGPHASQPDHQAKSA